MERDSRIKALNGLASRGPKSIIAGIGSRKLPGRHSEILFKAAFLSVLTEHSAFSSGGAAGSDATVEHGVKAALQQISNGKEYNELLRQYLHVYLPGNYFNGRSSSAPGMIDATKLAMHEKAKQIVKDVHPAFKKNNNPEEVPYEMKPYVMNLHARNGHQALGANLDAPVRSIICYTGDGAKPSTISYKTGGTGQALRLAEKYKIPVINIGNKSDEAKLQKWIEKRGKSLYEKYGIDVDKAHHDYVSNFTSGLNHHVGDLISDIGALNLDVIVHGCNCFNTMGAGIAKIIKEDFPEAFLADQATVKGDRKKLGTYTSAESQKDGRQVTIVNAYTQYKYGGDEDLYFDYDAFKKILSSLNETYPGARIGFPKIGSDLAGGCWLTVAEMIKNHGSRLNTVIVSRPDDLEYKPELKKQREKANEQLGLQL